MFKPNSEFSYKKLPNYYRVLEILQTSIHTGILPILLSRHYTEFIHASIMKRIEDIQIQLVLFHIKRTGQIHSSSLLPREQEEESFQMNSCLHDKIICNKIVCAFNLLTIK